MINNDTTSVSIVLNGLYIFSNEVFVYLQLCDVDTGDSWNDG